MDPQENLGLAEEPTGDVSSIDADALLESVEKGEIKTEAPAPPGDPGKDPVVPEGGEPEQWEIKHDGKTVKADRDKMTQWAQMGYDYSQRMREFNDKQSALQEQEQSLKQYQDIDEYAKANPEWFQHVLNNFESVSTGNPVEQPAQTEVDPHVAALQDQIKELRDFKDTLEGQQVAYTRQAEDEQLSGEIKSMRDEHSHLDWDSVDEHGQSLEQRVLTHGVNHDVPSFRLAFRDFTYDQMLSKAEERGMEKAAQERQKQTKLGLIGRTKQPVKGLQSAANVKEKSYEELMDEGMAELLAESNS